MSGWMLGADAAPSRLEEHLRREMRDWSRLLDSYTARAERARRAYVRAAAGDERRRLRSDWLALRDLATCARVELAGLEERLRLLP